jgi:hypothetical protein
MRFGKQVIGLALAVAVLSAGPVLGVGYECHFVNGPSGVTSTEKAKKPVSVVEALKEASFIEKVPGCLDRVADTVKALLGQFGVAQNNTP